MIVVGISDLFIIIQENLVFRNQILEVLVMEKYSNRILL